MEPMHASVDETPARTDRAPRLILFLTVFIDLLGFGIVIPFLPLFAERMGVGAIGVGMVLATYSFMQLLCAPLLGRISDRVGRRPIIMIGLAGSSVGYLLYGAATSFFWLLVSRALHGACAATVSTAQAYIADTTDESDRAQGMGLIGAAFGLGFVLGPAFGGLLGHSSLRTPAFFAAALSVGNLLFAAIALPESHHSRGGVRLAPRVVLGPLLKLPYTLVRSRLRSLFSIAFIFTSAFAALEATFALVASRVYGFGASGVGWLLALAGLLQALAQGYLVGRLARTLGEAWLIRAGAIIMFLGLIAIGDGGPPWLLAVLVSLAAVGYGIASPAVASVISKKTSRQHQGEILGANQSVLSLARIFGPIAGGAAYQFVGAPAPYVIGAISVLLSIILLRPET